MPNTFNTTTAQPAVVQPTVPPDVGGPLRVVVAPELQVRQLHATNPHSGFPRYVAVRPKPSNGGGRQQWEALFYPTPHEAITVEYRHSVSPEPLSDANPYPLGGRHFAELLLQSCLAVAEERVAKGEGVALKRFMGRLAAAIQIDSQSLIPTDDGVWPIGDTSTLTVNKAYLKKIIGLTMGIGPHQSSWSHKQQHEVVLALETGLRKFYNPPLVSSRFGHQWSFLFPTVQLNTAADQYVYDMPEDFAMLHGPLTYAPGRNTMYPELRVVGEHQIRKRLQAESLRSRPTMVAYRPKPPDASGATRYELMLWPIPDGDYPITYRYRFNPSMLADEAVLPHGGPPHAQTVIEACLAAVEELQGKLGIHSQMFMTSLAASIAQDQKVSSPDGLGFNRDLSDSLGWHSGDWRDCVDSSPVTYNGNLYD